MPTRAPSAHPISQHERREMQGTIDHIQQNMQETLSLKKMLAAMDSKAREAKREMKKKNRYYYIL